MIKTLDVSMDGILRKMNMDKILDNFIKYIFDTNLFYYDSMDSYFSRKEPTLRRKVRFYLNFLLLVIITVKYGVLSLYPDKLQWTLMKDFSIVFGKQSNLPHGLWLGFGFLTIAVKSVVVYLESRKNLNIFDFFLNWKERKPMYQISQRHVKKITLRAFIIYYGYIRIFMTILSLTIVLMTFCTTIAAHLHYVYGNAIILWLWTFYLMIFFNEIILTLNIGTFIVYIPITLLNYKFDELIEKLRVSIRWNNEQRLHQLLQSYNELIDVVQQLSGLYNIIIGLAYCIVPYITAINIELIDIKRNDLLFKSLKMLYLFLFIVINIGIFIINQISASITVRNKSIHKYLYPMFICERKTKIRTKLSIDSFIARLNTQFIGFYCFNLFKFTKMAFYQYAFTVSTSYFLIKKIL